MYDCYAYEYDQNVRYIIAGILNYTISASKMKMFYSITMGYVQRKGERKKKRESRIKTCKNHFY